MELSENERYFLSDGIKDALREIEELSHYENFVDGHPGVSQGVVDKLHSALGILGETYDE